MAFASIDPRSFKITPEHPDDTEIYRQFTSLQNKNLQTWIAVGGWEFNDKGVTRKTWSELASSMENRAAFVNSVLNFMEEYKFQGLDVDWEYPAAPNRGGRDEDTKNQVSMLSTQRSALAGPNSNRLN